MIFFDIEHTYVIGGGRPSPEVIAYARKIMRYVQQVVARIRGPSKSRAIYLAPHRYKAQKWEQRPRIPRPEKRAETRVRQGRGTSEVLIILTGIEREGGGGWVLDIRAGRV